MMNEIDLERLRAALAKHPAHKINLYRGDELARSVPVPAGRKRNAAVIAVVGKLEWSRAELVDRAGGTLDVVDAQADDNDRDAPELELGDRETKLLGMLLKAQQIALSHREKETQIALNACTASVRMLTDAVGALAGMHKQTLAAQAEAHAASITAALEAAQQAEGAEGGGLMSAKLMEQIAPLIMAKLLAPGPAPAPTPSNGAKS